MFQRILPLLEILIIIGICTKMEIRATDAGIEVERLTKKTKKDIAACYTLTLVLERRKVIRKPRRALEFNYY